MKIAEQESQKKYAERLLPTLVATKKPIIFVATKCDNLDRDSLNYLIHLATKKKAYQVVETSMFKGINVETPFLLTVNQITKKFSHIKNLIYPDALIVHEQVINETILLFQKFIDQEITNFRLKVAQIIPNIKSDPKFGLSIMYEDTYMQQFACKRTFIAHNIPVGKFIQQIQNISCAIIFIVHLHANCLHICLLCQLLVIGPVLKCCLYFSVATVGYFFLKCM